MGRDLGLGADAPVGDAGQGSFTSTGLVARCKGLAFQMTSADHHCVHAVAYGQKLLMKPIAETIDLLLLQPGATFILLEQRVRER